MLVLSRRSNEQIVIGQDIIVTIVEIRGDKVRLGIEAPSHVPVHRQEVFLSLRKAQSSDTASDESPTVSQRSEE